MQSQTSARNTPSHKVDAAVRSTANEYVFRCVHVGVATLHHALEGLFSTHVRDFFVEEFDGSIKMLYYIYIL